MGSAPGVVTGAAIIAAAAIGWPALLLVPVVVICLGAVDGSLRPSMPVLALVAVSLMLLRTASLDAQMPVPDLAISIGGEGTVEGLPEPTRAGQRLVLVVENLTFANDEQRTVDGRIMVWTDGPVRVEPGQRVRIAWTLETNEMLAPGFASWLVSKRVQGAAFGFDVTVIAESHSPLRYVSRLRNRINDTLQSILPGDTGALAMGLVTGDDAGLSDEGVEAFRRTGTSHLTAVSGSNMTMLFAIWITIVPSHRWRRSVLLNLAIVATLLGYVALVGPEPSTVRAASVAILGLGGQRLGRLPDALTLLTVSAAGMLLWNPLFGKSLGFWLSVVASFAILTAINAGGDQWTSRAMVRTSAFGIVLASVLTTPLLVATFGTWSPTGILANLLIGPLMTVVFPVVFVLALASVPLGTGVGLVAWIPGIILDLVLDIIQRVAAVSAPVAVGTTGITPIVLASVPVMVLLPFLSQDARRWLRLIHYRWQREPMLVAMICVGPVVGGVVLLLLVEYFELLR